MTPDWYYRLAMIVPGVLMLLLRINRTPEFGASVSVTNAVVLIVRAAGIGGVTHWRSDTVSALSMGVTIIGGSLVLAGLSSTVPVLGMAGGALWTGCCLGMPGGIILTSGDHR